APTLGAATRSQFAPERPAHAAGRPRCRGRRGRAVPTAGCRGRVAHRRPYWKSFSLWARIHARPRMSTAPWRPIGCCPVASNIDTVANLAKRRGLVFQAGEIYGGTKSAWDYGPLGVELKENIKRQWWRSVVTSRDDVVGLDSSIILPRDVWVASGHV